MFICIELLASMTLGTSWEAMGESKRVSVCQQLHGAVSSWNPRDCSTANQSCNRAIFGISFRGLSYPGPLLHLSLYSPSVLRSTVDSLKRCLIHDPLLHKRSHHVSQPRLTILYRNSLPWSLHASPLVPTNEHD
jgi:hypothetical protein